jgi:hypothetical protein
LRSGHCSVEKYIKEIRPIYFAFATLVYVRVSSSTLINLYKYVIYTPKIYSNSFNISFFEFHVVVNFKDVLSPSQNISKRWSIKVNVFGPNFEPNTSSLFDSFLLTFWDGGSICLCLVNKF